MYKQQSKLYSNCCFKILIYSRKKLDKYIQPSKVLSILSSRQWAADTLLLLYYREIRHFLIILYVNYDILNPKLHNFIDFFYKKYLLTMFDVSKCLIQLILYNNHLQNYF